MKYQHIFFDLDGTLTDSADGIVNSVRYALEKQGIVPPAREQLLPFVGPPLLDSFHKYYGLDREQGMQAIEAYREYFTDRGWKENSVYEGIPEVLKQLKDAGAHLYIATSKPEPFARPLTVSTNISMLVFPFSQIQNGRVLSPIPARLQADLVLLSLRLMLLME